MLRWACPTRSNLCSCLRDRARPEFSVMFDGHETFSSSLRNRFKTFLVVSSHRVVWVQSLNVESLNLEQSRQSRLFLIDKTEIEYLIGRDGAT
jgi:hypothetical protein